MQREGGDGGKDVTEAEGCEVMAGELRGGEQREREEHFISRIVELRTIIFFYRCIPDHKQLSL